MTSGLVRSVVGSGLILPKSLQKHCAKRNAEIAEAAGGELVPQQRQRLEENSEYQVRSRMSKDEKYRGAIETLVRARMQFYQSMGIERTEDFVRKEMIDMVVRKYARDHNIE